MRRGCMPLGDIQCDGCRRIITPAERYLVTNEENGVEVDNGPDVRYCVECALNKGYASYNEEKGEKTLTFFLEVNF